MKLRIGVAGVGYFGRFHTLKAAQSPRVDLVGVYDRDAERAASVAAEAGTVPMALGALIAASDAVIVAAPAGVHYDIAVGALSAGRHVLVEKPIATTLEQAEALILLAKERSRVLQIGHLERFSAATAAIAEQSGLPLFIEATRIAPFKPRGTDVSVVLDVMIHDIDLVLFLMGNKVDRVEALGASALSDRDDMCDARLMFSDGRAATLRGSRISPHIERKMRIWGTSGVLSVDFAGRALTVTRRQTGDEAQRPGAPGFGIERVSWKDRDALEAQLNAFVDSCLDGAPVKVPGEAGQDALRVALLLEQAMAEGRARLMASGALLKHR